MDYEKYNQGESVVYSYLKEKQWLITDRRKEAQYQQQDIDFSIYKPNKNIYFNIEVKQSNYLTTFNRTFFIETIKSIEKNIQGWLYTTSADFIFYCANDGTAIYIFTPQQMKQYIASYEKKLDYKIVPDYINGKLYKHSKGAIVSADDFKSKGYSLQEIILSAF